MNIQQNKGKISNWAEIDEMKMKKIKQKHKEGNRA